MDEDLSCFLFFFAFYLKSKLVKEVVDEVFNAADDAVVQMVARDIVENDPGGRRREFVPHSVVFLMAVDGHLERQQSKHQQIVLHRENPVLTLIIQHSVKLTIPPSSKTSGDLCSP